jgi:hypothetical protein
MTTMSQTANELCVVHALSGKLDVDEAWDAAWFYCMFGGSSVLTYRVEVMRFDTKEEMIAWSSNTRLHPAHSIPFLCSEIIAYRPLDADEYDAELSDSSVCADAEMAKPDLVDVDELM